MQAMCIGIIRIFIICLFVHVRNGVFRFLFFFSADKRDVCYDILLIFEIKRFLWNLKREERLTTASKKYNLSAKAHNRTAQPREPYV